MAYKALAKIKKNSPAALLTGQVLVGGTSFPVDHTEYFHDEDGVLIVDGISIWDPSDGDPTHIEEITITASSTTTGAGNLTGATRGVKADGTNGAARQWEAGAKIAVHFTTGIQQQIAGNFAAHESGKLANSGAANGKIYIGKADGTFALATLTQGANITITNADGAVTIASTGGGDFLVQQIFS